MSSKATIAILLIILPLFWMSCAKETVDPVTTGSITGQVQNTETGEPVAGASVTTAPGTEAVLTGPEGKFTFIDISTGNYTIEVSKEGYKTSTVRVAVTEDDTTSAQILLKPKKDDKPAAEVLEVSDIIFFNTQSNDSSFVEVEFSAKNISEHTTITNYEIYFKIDTNGKTFYQEIEGDTLEVGEKTISDFTKYIRTYQAQSVTVSGLFTE